jgi:hypothetical protein
MKFTILNLLVLVMGACSPVQGETTLHPSYIYWRTTEAPVVDNISIKLVDRGPPCRKEVNSDLLVPESFGTSGKVELYEHDLYENKVLVPGTSYTFRVLRFYPDDLLGKYDSLAQVIDSKGKILVDRTRCPVHHVELQLLEGRIEYGLRLIPLGKTEFDQCPYYDRVVHGGCLRGDQKLGLVLFCPDCERAFKKFQEAKKPNQALEPAKKGPIQPTETTRGQ